MNVKFTSHKEEILEAVEKATDKALNDIGDKAVEYAQNLAAVDTGNMKSSITHERYDENTEIFGTSNDKAPYKEVDYAVLVELGSNGQRSQPFIRPAAEGHIWHL